MADMITVVPMRTITRWSLWRFTHDIDFSSPASRLPCTSIEVNCPTSACFCCSVSFTYALIAIRQNCYDVRSDQKQKTDHPCQTQTTMDHAAEACSKKLVSSRSSSFSKIPTFRRWYTSSVGPKFPCIEACNCSKRCMASSARMRDFVKALCKTATIRCSSTAVVVEVARIALIEVVSRLESASNWTPAGAAVTYISSIFDGSSVEDWRAAPLSVVEAPSTSTALAFIVVDLARIALNIVKVICGWKSKTRSIVIKVATVISSRSNRGSATKLKHLGSWNRSPRAFIRNLWSAARPLFCITSPLLSRSDLRMAQAKEFRLDAGPMGQRVMTTRALSHSSRSRSNLAWLVRRCSYGVHFNFFRVQVSLEFHLGFFPVSCRVSYQDFLSGVQNVQMGFI